MNPVAKRPKHVDVVQPVTREWLERVAAKLEAGGRGAQANLAREIGCSTGALAELLAVEKDGTPKSKYSRYVSKINEVWPDVMPFSQDTEEVRHLLDGIDVSAKELLAALRAMPEEERRLHLQLILKRPIEKKP